MQSIIPNIPLGGQTSDSKVNFSHVELACEVLDKVLFFGVSAVLQTKQTDLCERICYRAAAEHYTSEYIAQESKDFKEPNQHNDQEQPYDRDDTECDEHQDMLECVVHAILQTNLL
ncbi:hypothetical protein F4Y59_02390 [Candidatus Poribacteria bacterium]|nr:hypothetical protein [Candidatus Poribacteria bacterium]MXY26994.1 hypothetical protein [Candidatus Poribacteria bacterium]MYK18385.1 hypothetical protein [Candidatus Poribacteria bacterium]